MWRSIPGADPVAGRGAGPPSADMHGGGQADMSSFDRPDAADLTGAGLASRLAAAWRVIAAAALACAVAVVAGKLSLVLALGGFALVAAAALLPGPPRRRDRRGRAEPSPARRHPTTASPAWWRRCRSPRCWSTAARWCWSPMPGSRRRSARPGSASPCPSPCGSRRCWRRSARSAAAARRGGSSSRPGFRSTAGSRPTSRRSTFPIRRAGPTPRRDRASPTWCW